MQNPNVTPYTVDELHRLIGTKNRGQHSPDNMLTASQIYPHLINDGCFTFYTITDYVNMKYVYVSPMVERICGYPSAMFETGGLEFMFSLVHPAEIESLRLIHKQIVSFFQSLPAEEKLHYSYSYNVRIRKSDNTYIRLLCQLNCEELNDNSQPRIGREMFADITQFCNMPHMQLIIRNQHKPAGMQDQIYHYTSADSKLTNRGKEINDLVTQGHSSKEIAEILSLSKNTVDTYRRKIRKSLKMGQWGNVLIC